MPGPSARGPVVVCGAGAAGIAAALAAARAGATVQLVESQARPGGTVAGALLHTIAGLYDSTGKLLGAGLPAELVARLKQADPAAGERQMGRTWVFAVSPAAYRECITAWLAEETRIDLHLQSRVAQVRHVGRSVSELIVETPAGRVEIAPQAVIDATGDAHIARLIDPALVFDDPQRAAGGWIYRLRGAAPGALDFPKGVGIARTLRTAVAAGELPHLCAQAWLDRGLAAEEVYLKLAVPLPPPGERAEARASLEEDVQRAAEAVVAMLRQLPGFADVEIAEAGMLGIRDGGRLQGRYVLTADDVRSCRRFDDAACRGAWPIEYWDAERGVSLEYLPAGDYYEIPMRSLQVDSLDNFWVAGRCLSADRLAQASARVAGICWGMGEAVGLAAARSAGPDPAPPAVAAAATA